MTRSDYRWKTVLCLLAIAAVLLASKNVEAEPAGSRADNEELPATVLPEQNADAWVISTRCVPASCPTGIGPESFSYRVAAGACSDWEQSDAARFFDSTAVNEPVIVFIHGNRTDSCEAIQDGWPVYERLRSESGGRHFRFVIWSWPAERVRGGPRKDALVKAARSDTQSFYLAAWLERLPASTPVTLIGYSFGARVIGGALQLSEGGPLLGRTLPAITEQQDRRLLRVMLVAAALDCEWLLPGNRNGLAPQAVEKMFITKNCCDHVLRFYPRMRRCDSSSALGFTGPAAPGRLVEAGLSFETVPVECQVGKDHAWHTYLRSHAVRSRLAWYAFLVQESPSDN